MHLMLRLLGLVISVGIADSLNPSTIGPALYIATHERGRRHVLHFTLAVFAVYLLAGTLIAAGPGELLLSVIPHPRHQVRYIAETAGGVVLMVVAGALWRNRAALASKEMPGGAPRGRSSALLGASITFVELPTAFPYFAVLAALVGSGVGFPREVGLLLIFNVLFILPLLGIIVVLTVAGERSQRLLIRGREFVAARWPHVLSALLLAAGTFVVLLGVSGLVSPGHGSLHSFARGLHQVLRLHP